MTLVRFRLLAPIDLAVGKISARPTSRHVIAAGVVLPAPFTISIGGTPVTVDIPPTDTEWVWEFRERTPGGAVRYCAVPEAGGVLDYENLVDIDPATLEPSVLTFAGWDATKAAAEDYALDAATSSAEAYISGLAAESAAAAAAASAAEAAAIWALIQAHG